MVSAIIILFLSGCLLLLVRNVVHTKAREIRRLEDWEANRHDVDIASFRMLLDHGEGQLLKSALSVRRFRSSQRKRLRRAWRMLQLEESNTAVLMKLCQLP